VVAVGFGITYTDSCALRDAGACLGATSAFLLGRFAIRDAVQDWSSKYKLMRAIDAAITAQGKRIVTLLRLSPVIPFNVFNYVMGATSISVEDFVFGFLGMVPGTVAFCFIGSAVGATVVDIKCAGSTASDDGAASNAQKAILIVGIVATVIATCLISKYAKRALTDALAAAEAAETETAETAEITSSM
jgi:uncharacterized membrane protein YdjX (TVP38/TMEM64 family)